MTPASLPSAAIAVVPSASASASASGQQQQLQHNLLHINFGAFFSWWIDNLPCPATRDAQIALLRRVRALVRLEENDRRSSRAQVLSQQPASTTK